MLTLNTAVSNVSDKTIVLGVTGGIAAFKAAALASLLVKKGMTVKTVMTKAATEFITPLTFQALTKQPVYSDVFAEHDPTHISHIDLADHADAIVIAPATADFIAKVAHGMGDDMLTTILLAARCPVIIAPSMNVHMYANPLVQKNIATLREIGYEIAEPGEGLLACGYEGKGRLMEPADLVFYIERALMPKPLRGKNVLVTAGGTKERIDPVRYLTNDSTGTMGVDLARVAWLMGARVTVVAANISVPVGPGIEVIPALSAVEMYEQVHARLPEADIVIMAAAVADYRPREVADFKIKKTGAALSIDLVQNPDILASLQGKYKQGAFSIGFAAETHDIEHYALEKLQRKGVDLLVVNNVLESGAGFGYGTNRVDLYDREGFVESLPLASKFDVARMIIERTIARIGVL